MISLFSKNKEVIVSLASPVPPPIQPGERARLAESNAKHRRKAGELFKKWQAHSGQERTKRWWG